LADGFGEGFRSLRVGRIEGDDRELGEVRSRSVPKVAKVPISPTPCAAITIGSALDVRSGLRSEVGEDLVRAALDSGQRVVAGNAPGDIGRKDLFPHLYEVVVCGGDEEDLNEVDIRVVGRRRHR
jgi:hypothetical protein